MASEQKGIFFIDRATALVIKKKKHKARETEGKGEEKIIYFSLR